MKIAITHGYLSEFAPKGLIVLGQTSLFTLGIVLSWLTNTPVSFKPPQAWHFLFAVLLGLVIGALSLPAKFFKPLRAVLDWIFLKYLGKDQAWWIFFLIPGLVSLGEETFFRGFLQPKIGLVPTALIFSLFHFRTNVKTSLIIPLAFILGLVLGTAYIKTGTLIIPIAIHFAILFFTGFLYLKFINRS